VPGVVVATTVWVAVGVAVATASGTVTRTSGLASLCAPCSSTARTTTKYVVPGTTSTVLHVVCCPTWIVRAYSPLAVPRPTRKPARCALGDASHVTVNASAAVARTLPGGSGAGSMIVSDRLALPLVAVIVIGAKLGPLETYSVTTGGWPAPSVVADVESTRARCSRNWRARQHRPLWRR
jgi:hypothetical protein